MDFFSLLFWIPLVLFFLIVLWTISLNIDMFLKAYGRRHRISGAVLLVWLLVGFIQIATNSYDSLSPMAYDILLGVIATTTTLTAAFDFQKAHSHVKNIASGTLEKEATVTYNEMIEHSFYQLLNLIQIIFIHCLPLISSYSLLIRLLFAYLATSLWFFRSSFPVNAFSDNYNKGQNPLSLISLMYRTKKYQYIFYKHFLLHSLTFSLAITAATHSHPVGSLSSFRLYWLCLNTSYVMEFFLQTLVKKSYLSQSSLLSLQVLLMFVSSLVAVDVLSRYVILWLGFVSFGLNMINRGREMMNITILTLIAYLVTVYSP